MNFFQKLVSVGTPESSKRWITVVLAGIFFIINIVCIVIFIILFIEMIGLKTTAYSQQTADRFFELFDKVIEADVAIIMFGIGAIVLSNLNFGSWFGRGVAAAPVTPVPVQAPVTTQPKPAPAPAPAPQKAAGSEEDYVIPILDEE